MNKEELRAAIRQKKRAMSQAEIREKSEALGQKLAEHPLYRQAECIYGYLPYNQEVRTIPMLRSALNAGKRVAVPKVYGEEMRFIYLTDLSQVETGYCGIPEPVADGPVASESDALVLMPGLAFDREGNRMGYGGGFYDRFLEREPLHPTLALCYDFQLVEAVPVEAYDKPVDAVVWA